MPRKAVTRVTRTVFRKAYAKTVVLRRIVFVYETEDGIQPLKEVPVEGNLLVKEGDSSLILHTIVSTLFKELVPPGYRVVPLLRSEGGFAYLDIENGGASITILVAPN